MEDKFSYWFALKQSASAGDWQSVRGLLLQEPDKELPLHPLTEAAVLFAFDQGHMDVVNAFLARGFAGGAAGTFQFLARIVDKMDAPDKRATTLAVVDGMCRNFDDFVVWLVENSHEKALMNLQDAGRNIRAEGRSYCTAFFRGNQGMMRMLFGRGAVPYHPSILTAAKNGGAQLPALKAAYAIWQLQCDVHAQGAEVEKDIARTDIKFTADYFLSPTVSGARRVDVLAARGKAGAIFDAHKWLDDVGGAQKVYDALKGMGAEKGVDMALFASTATRLQLQRSVRPMSRIRPKPPGA